MKIRMMKKCLSLDKGWVDTHHFSEKSTIEEKVSEMKLEEDEEDHPGVNILLKIENYSEVTN